MDLLLHIASLSRVVEWWVAEKIEWQNFDDEDESQEHPVKFILAAHSGEAEQHEARGSVSKGDQTSSPARHRDGGTLSGDGLSATSSPLLLPADKVSERRARRSRANSRAFPPGEQPTAGAHRSHAKQDTPNVLMELSLDGDSLLYLSPSWRKVVGTDPSELIDTPVSELLATADRGVFMEATQQLEANSAHTVEIAFRLRLPQHLPVTDDSGQVVGEIPLFQRMEGKGMLMHDRQLGLLSHTMWVLKPTSSPEPETNLDAGSAFQQGEPLAERTSSQDTAGIPMEPVLCRICERDIPAWFFEKHSESCNEVHRLEMEIAESNESLHELRKTARSIFSAIENSADAEPPEYQGIKITTPPPQPPSALEGLNRSLSLRQTQPAVVRKQHLRSLEAVIDALHMAADISTPAVKEDDSDEPIEKQRLLSPTSEDKVLQVRGWSKPHLDDVALDALMADAENAIRAKLSGVNRMINTIVYVETVRLETEERVEAVLANISEGADNVSSDSEEDEDRPASQGMPEASTVDDLVQKTGAMLLDSPATKSVSSGRLADAEVPLMEDGVMSESMNRLPGIPIPLGTQHPPPSYLSPAAGTRQHPHTGTPPFSPRLSPAHDGQALSSSRKLSVSHHRGSVAGSIPMSPRLPPVAPASRPTATSIKDFDVIKPISKGAFGSVFLAKKRATGEYYAIKVLKKSDMIAKNQVLNVKAERMILMTQTQSPFVVKLLFTFNDANYLYLVMEYLPGGDCASLCKMLGGLDADWAKQYVAEIVNGLDHLHRRGIVHR